jgi:MtrB/PioB family decaheme-associated outer membrane protein
MTTTGMLRRTLGSLTALAITMGLVSATPASAQLRLGDWGTLEGGAEAGGRFFINEPPKSSRAKWEEYVDYTGPFLYNLDLRFWSKDDKYWAEFGGSKWGGQDQEYTLGAGRLGLFELGFEWNQTPHVISTDARLLAVQSRSGSVASFNLPAQRPSLIFYNYAPTLDEIAVRWDAARIFFKVTPTPELDIKAEYTRTFKHGDKPFGMAFGSPGNNFYEVLQPIDQVVNDFRLTAVWAKENWQLQFNYTLSVFTNDYTAIRADNPCFGLPAANSGPLPGCGTGDANGAPATGQSSVMPSNLANTFSLAGGVSLPMRTRITGNFSYSRQTQNADFLPMTINPNIAGVAPLPQDSLNGLVQTILFNLGATSRPLQPLTLSFKYRYFNLMDDSDTITFQNTVLDDRTLAPGAFRAGRWPYSTQAAQADARWQFGAPAAVTLGGGWDWMNRSDHREVPIANTAYAKFAIDATPYEWLLARFTYRPSFRRISEYDTRAHAEHAVIEEPATVSQGQSILLRKFDEAEVNRQSLQFYLQLTPHETLTITPTVNWNYDNFLSSQTPLLSVDPAGQNQRSNFLGVQNGSGWQVGADVNWAPVERFSLAVGYMYENYFRKMESRSRPVTGTTALDFSNFDWISDINDIYQTVYANVRVGIIPRMLEATVNTSYAGALGTVKSRNPVAPTSGTPAQNATAKAQRFPAYEDNLFRLDASLSYHFWKNWTAKLGYVFETWRKTNWQTDTLNPYIPGVSSIWLGNDLRDYTANTIYATLAYTFR